MFIRHIPLPTPAGSMRYANWLSYRLVDARYNLNCTTALLTGFYLYPKTRLSLCAQVIDWCFCARVFSCPVGNVFLPYFVRTALLSRDA
jgi:hypothetical protein